MKDVLLKIKKVVIENWPVAVVAVGAFMLARHCGAC